MADTSSTPFQPLFDRLTAPGQASARPYVDLGRLKQSVQVELQRLLSCRSRLPFDRYLAEAADVLDYGIPDSTALTMASVHDRIRLAQAIQRAITVFEPRLRDVTVEITPTAENGVDALVYIDAALQGGPGARRTAFVMPSRGQAHAGDDTDHDAVATVDARRVGPERPSNASVPHQEARDA